MEHMDTPYLGRKKGNNMEPQSGLTPVETPISPRDCVKSSNRMIPLRLTRLLRVSLKYPSTHDDEAKPAICDVHYSFTPPTYSPT